MMAVQRFFSNPGPSEMPRTADIVIIGGGPAGTAALWAIERAAPGTQTVLIEQQSQLASGATNASLENYRTCWPTPCLARLMQRSIEVFHNADEYLGEGGRNALGLKQQGYMYCAFNARQAETLKQEVKHLQSIGLSHVEFLDADEAMYRYPWTHGRVVGVKFDPTAGWMDSHALVYRFAQSAPSARILQDIASVRIRVSGGKVKGVSTPNGDIASPHVIIAAGANSRQVGRAAGIEIPVVLRPRQSFTTPWRHPDYPEDAPCVISAAPFPHVRPEARSGAVFGWEYGWNTKNCAPDGVPIRDYLIDPLWPVEQFRDPRFPSVLLTLMARQFGHEDGYGFADSRYLRGIDHRAGYYVYRDHTTAYYVRSDGSRHHYHSQRAIIDAWPEIEGIYLSVAHIGHGIMSAPAAGEIVASKVLGLPLPDPIFADFGLNVPWAEYDSGGLGAGN